LALLLVGLLAAGAVLTRPGAEAAPAGEPGQIRPPDRAQDGKQEEPGKEGPVAVRVVRPQPGGLKREARHACTLQPFETQEIVAPVSGFLKTLNVDIGARVRKGELLAEIDVPLLALEEKQAELGVKQAQGKIREAEARAAAAKAEVQLAKA